MGKNSIYPTNTHIKRKTMTPAALAANRANAARGGRPVGVMDAQRLSFRDRCRRNDERHVEILEYIAEHDTNTGFRLTAIRDLFDRGHGRPNQPLEGSGPGGSIPFQVVLPVAIHKDEDEG